MSTSLSIGNPRPDLMGIASAVPTGYKPFVRELLRPQPTNQDAGAFYKIDPRYPLRVGEVEWGAKGQPKTNTYEKTQDTYITVRRGTQDFVDPLDRAIVGRSYDEEQVIAIQQLDILRRKEDVDGVATIRAAVSGVAAGTAWSNAASDPVTDVNTGHAAIQALGRGRADTLLISFARFLSLSSVTKVKDRIQYTQLVDGMLPLPILAQLFSVDRVIVADGVYGSGNIGQAASTSTISQIWPSDEALLLITDGVIWSGKNIGKLSLGRTMYWDGNGGDWIGGLESMATEDLPYGQRAVIAHQMIQHKILDASSGYRITGC